MESSQIENEIEICTGSDQSSDETNQSDANYNLISHYYQILLNFLENGVSEYLGRVGQGRMLHSSSIRARW